MFVLTAAQRVLTKIDPSQLEFPLGDSQFEDYVLTKVERSAKEPTYINIHFGGYGMCVDLAEHKFTHPVEAGMHLRLYSEGPFSVNRGVFINGRKVFYKTPAEQEAEFKIAREKAQAEEAVRKDRYATANQFARDYIAAQLDGGQSAGQLFGNTWAAWLDRYQSGNVVFAPVMGGLDFKYDKAIIECVEVYLRMMHESQFDFNVDDAALKAQWEHVNTLTHSDPNIDRIGPSGAMMGAARNMASMLWNKTPAVALPEAVGADRRMLLIVNKKIAVGMADMLEAIQ